MPLDKGALRKQFQAVRRAFSLRERQMVNEGIFQNVIGLESFRRAQTVFLYCSTAEEVDTRRLLEASFCSGKRVCVPLCTAEKGVMQARELADPSRLSPGRFGIPEPPDGSPAVPPGELHFCIVPCLAADLAGNRLGYGGGYYDRFLARTPAEKAVLCPQACLAERLPAEPHDQRCGIVITERLVHIASKE